VFNLTFLNTVFLAGAAAAAIPILIHLLQRRRLRRIEFSDLRFLAPLNQRRMRSLTMRRLLLLALRVAIVVLTAVALARPSVRGSLSHLLPTRAHSSVLLLIDTSYSMRAEGEHGSAFAAAKTMAQRLLDVVERGDPVNVMTFDDAAHLLFESPVHDLALVRERIAALQPGHAATRYLPALQAALASLAKATEPNRELYVISDFAGANLDSLRADLRPAQGETRVTWVPVGVESFVNVSVEDVRVPPGAVLLGEPVHLGVTVRNHSADAPADCNLQVELAGKPKGEASLRLGGGAQQTQEFTLVASDPEAAAGVARKRIDRLPEDDVRYFVLPVLAQLRVLLVRGGGAGQGGAFYVARALSPAAGGHSPLALTEVEAPRLGSRDLDGVQVVVVAADAPLGGAQCSMLAEHVRDGGGLLLLAGQRATAETTNRELLERLGSARIRGIVEQAHGFLNLTDLRPAGILAGFGPKELRALEAVKFTRYAELVPGSGGRAVLGFSGGIPALVEGDAGRGKYMLLAFDASLEGSDLAVSTMFLPLLHRCVVYLAGETGRQKLGYTVGERIEVQVPLESGAGANPSAASPARPAGAREEAPARSFTVTTPAGRTEALIAREAGRMAIATYEETREPGHYIFTGLGRRLVRAVNVDPREADLQAADLGEFAKALGLEVAATIDAPEDVARSVRAARHGKELYKLVVVLVLVLVTLELFLSRGAGEAEPRT
jgi:hypothetical protein